jgi:predicted HAD superfamily phosphohydrolase YqeG
MRRAPKVVIDRRAILISLPAELQTRTLVVDVEPLLSPWDAAGDTVIAAATTFATEVKARIPSLQHLVFATNARMRLIKASATDGGFLFISAARKPWRINYLKGSPTPITVIGDQVLTDGLLAYRLGGNFLHWRPDHTVPLWPRMQTIAGKLIEDVFFSLQDIPAGMDIDSRM